ncbi:MULTISPECIES: hypothetical protein [Actinomadura]|uniref:Uncharacterized protein n=1 Tax=Actinomadura yumaensis TaxID=111807 RepID=A0ABW2CPG7_9ACTN|nr:hypothetical protein [Actinomadura sp. J1-007]MWK35221.1 hypothetical protein [Actinomadura sp. J1-007]
MPSELPPGWTIERVRALSSDDSASLLSTERRILLEERNDGRSAYVPVRAGDVGAVIGFHGLCLVRLQDEWYMGGLRQDGSVVCWASYGTDLQVAFRSL